MPALLGIIRTSIIVLLEIVKSKNIRSPYKAGKISFLFSYLLPNLPVLHLDDLSSKKFRN
jgi:hypothetical protein